MPEVFSYQQKPWIVIVNLKVVCFWLSCSWYLPYRPAEKLHKVKLVEPKGGFGLSWKPSKISSLEIIETIQGPVKLSRCLLGVDACTHQKSHTVSRKLAELQEYIDSYLRMIMLDELLRSRGDLYEKKMSTGTWSDVQDEIKEFGRWVKSVWL